MTMRPGRPGPPAGGPAALLNAAIAYHQAGRLDEADAAYRRVLAAMPKHFDAMHLLGVVALQTGRLDEAKALISGALAVNPKFAAAHNNLGNVHLRQGHLDAAQASFEHAVKLQPGFADAHYNLGNQLRRQGRLQDAATHFRRAAAANGKSVQAHTNLGATLLDLGDARGAVKALESAVRLKPDHAEALSNLGLALDRAGEPARALDVLDRARKLDPKSTTALRNRGMVLARFGRHAEARQCLEARARGRAGVGRGALQSRQRTARQRQPCRGPRALPAGRRPRSRHGRGQDRPRAGASDLGRDDEAREHGRQLSQDHPASPAARIFEGTQCLDRDDTRGAATAFREAIALQGSNADAHYQLGIALLRQLRSQEAIGSFQRALAADPAHAGRAGRW